MKNVSMKLMTLGLTAVILICGLTACKINKSVNINADVKVNGEEVFSTQITTDSWEVPQINKVSVDEKKYFEEAVSELDGYFYEPVALLGTQIVSGTNYCFLCRPSVSGNNSVNSLVLTYIYVDLQGKASFLKDERLVLPGTEDTGADGTPLPGGWSYAESNEVTAYIRNVLYSANEKLTDVTYDAIAYAGSQVVSGTNHAIVCKTVSSDSDKNTKSSLAVVYVYEDLHGNCEIIDTAEIKLGV